RRSSRPPGAAAATGGGEDVGATTTKRKTGRFMRASLSVLLSAKKLGGRCGRFVRNSPESPQDQGNHRAGERQLPEGSQDSLQALAWSGKASGRGQALRGRGLSRRRFAGRLGVGGLVADDVAAPGGDHQPAVSCGRVSIRVFWKPHGYGRPNTST